VEGGGRECAGGSRARPLRDDDGNDDALVFGSGLEVGVDGREGPSGGAISREEGGGNAEHAISTAVFFFCT
jgi:hypothetical protein